MDEITLEQDVDEVLGLVPAGTDALDDPQASALEPEDEDEDEGDEGSDDGDGSDDD